MNKGTTLFPRLTTQRLTLRELEASDSKEIWQLRSDTEINKFLNRKPSKTIEDAMGFIENILENKDEGQLYWAISKNDTGKLMGTICLFDFVNDQHKGEIGYELLPEYQGKGFMQEAAQKVITYANQTLGLQKIDAITHKDNHGSTRLLLKLGFQELQLPDPEHQNLILFRLSNTD